MRYDELTQDEQKIIDDYRQRINKKAQEIKTIRQLYLAYGWAKWLRDNKEPDNYQVFITEFGYAGDDSESDKKESYQAATDIIQYVMNNWT